MREAVASGADIIMLDNLSDKAMREAMRMIGGRARVEISGGVTPDRIPVLATFGADTVSAGALTTRRRRRTSAWKSMFDSLPDDLADALARAGSAADLRFAAEIGSTNDAALTLAHTGARDGTAVLAEVQTAGRGRRGRTWFRPPDRASICRSSCGSSRPSPCRS